MSGVTTHTVLRSHAVPSGQRHETGLMHFRRATRLPLGEYGAGTTTLFFSTQG